MRERISRLCLTSDAKGGEAVRARGGNEGQWEFGELEVKVEAADDLCRGTMKREQTRMFLRGEMMRAA